MEIEDWREQKMTINLQIREGFSEIYLPYGIEYGLIEDLRMRNQFCSLEYCSE